VQTVDARIDPATRAVQVRADLPNPQRLLRPGMLINVEIAGAERTALLLPEIAVTQVGRDSFVFRVDGKGSVEQVKVAAASRRDGKVEIVEGVAIGDRIVVDGTGKLRPGNTIVEAGAGKPDAPAAKKG
jgi:membrane fusion protein (multidrug efflux system)